MATNGFASAPFTSAGGGNAGANSIYLTKITLQRAATISAILLSGSPGASGLNLRGLIYDGSHSALLGQSTIVTSYAIYYQRLPISPSVALAAGTYYVGYVCDSGINVYIDGSQASSSWYLSGGQSVTSPPNPIVSGSSQSNGLLIALEFDGTAAPTFGFGSDYTTGVTIGGGGTTAATTTASLQAARSVVTQSQASTGKYYAEFLIGGTINATNTRVGIISASVCVAPFAANNIYWGVWLAAGGTVIYNQGSSTSFVSFAAGDVIGIAVDTTSSIGAVWFSKNNGAWSNSGNPAAGTGGYPIFGSGPVNWPLTLFVSSNTAANFTLRDYTSSQSYAAPSGFGAWAGGSTGPSSGTAQAWAMVLA